MVPKTSTDEISPKREIFVSLSVAYAILLGLNARFAWFDDCLLAYSVSLLASLTCTALYLWWWRHTRHATEVYKWVTMLFLTMALDRALTAVARYLYVYDQAFSFWGFLDHWVWTVRSIPETLVLFFMIALVIGRITE